MARRSCPLLCLVCSTLIASAQQAHPPEPAKFPDEPQPVIHQTIFAVERDTLLPAEPTAPPVQHDVPLSAEIEAEGDFSPPTGSFTRFRYMPSRGTGGFGITSLEWGNDSSATWWEDSSAEGTTRFRADLGFGMHWWEGPKGNPPEAYIMLWPYTPPGLAPDLPPRVYDLYLDLLWQEHWNDVLMTDLMLRPGLFTDFRTTPPQAFRLRGHAIGLVCLSPNLQLVGGVDYINRVDIKLLPVAGVLWRPDEAARLHLVFPQPKLAVRITTRGDNECWAYVAGEYGGGAWTYKTQDESHDEVEYSDYRLVFGVEFVRCGQMAPHAQLELGYVFHRRIVLEKQSPDFDPKDTFMIGVRCSR